MNLVLVGAGGTGMCGIAGILHNLGYSKQIICLDSTESELTKKLEKLGLTVIIGKDQYSTKSTDHIIYSEACANSSEVIQAKSFKRKPKEQRFIGNYFDFLGEISKYFNTIGITGTNGKSTTTAMLLYVAKSHLSNLGLGILGALVPDLDNNNFYINPDKKEEIKNIFDYIFTGKGLDYSLIKKNIFILEACEYKRHFLKLDIDRGIITNIELDHTDYYKDLDDYTLAFQQFTQKTKNKILTTSNLSFGAKQSGVEESIKQKLLHTTIKNFSFTHLFGQHNNQNGSLVFELIKQLNPSVDESKLTDTIQDFKGLRRRLELLKITKKGAMIFSDYGHMASSIKLCHEAIKNKYPNKKITVIFQPHQINRILRERNDFQKSLKLYDNVIIYDIYAARENLAEQLDNFKHLQIENANTISELGNIFAQNCGGKYIQKIQKIEDQINTGNKDQIFVIFSAGDLDFKIRNSLI